MPMHPKEIEHMRQRKEHGLTYREVGLEFGISKSQVHRLLNPDTNAGLEAIGNESVDRLGK